MSYLYQAEMHKKKKKKKREKEKKNWIHRLRFRDKT